MWIQLRHLLTPHHTNNHRARALHVDALLLYVLVFAIFNVSFRLIYRIHPDILGYATDIRVEQLLTATNAKRQAAGLSSLQLNSVLSAAAAHKAQYMFQKNFWAHVAPDGKTPWDFIIGEGYHYTIAGENLAKNFSTSTTVVDAWMASQSHRENLLKSGYRDVGFAVVNGILNGEETTLVVQMFGTSNQLAVLPQVSPVKTEESRTAVVISEAASQSSISGEGRLATSLPLGFTAAYRQPLFDLPTVSRGAVLVFGGFLMALLIVDGWMIAKHRIVRVSGHTIAHMLFLTTLFISASAILQGTIL